MAPKVWWNHQSINNSIQTNMNQLHKNYVSVQKPWILGISSKVCDCFWQFGNDRFRFYSEDHFIISLFQTWSHQPSCILWHVVIKGRLELLPQGSFDSWGPPSVALLHWLNVIFIEVFQIVEYGSPHILDFGAGFPVNTCTVVLAPRRTKACKEHLLFIYLARSASLCRRLGGSAGAGGAGVGAPQAAEQEVCQSGRAKSPDMKTLLICLPCVNMTRAKSKSLMSICQEQRENPLLNMFVVKCSKNIEKNSDPSIYHFLNQAGLQVHKYSVLIER